MLTGKTSGRIGGWCLVFGVWCLVFGDECFGLHGYCLGTGVNGKDVRAEHRHPRWHILGIWDSDTGFAVQGLRLTVEDLGSGMFSFRIWQNEITSQFGLTGNIKTLYPVVFVAIF